jgi:hypothetical protein
MLCIDFVFYSILGAADARWSCHPQPRLAIIRHSEAPHGGRDRGGRWRRDAAAGESFLRVHWVAVVSAGPMPAVWTPTATQCLAVLSNRGGRWR